MTLYNLYKYSVNTDCADSPPVKFIKEEILSSSKVYVGSGTYGTVYKNVHSTSGESLAVKVLHKVLSQL